VDEKEKAGFHRVLWNGKDRNDRDVATGIYFYSLKAGSYRAIRKMILLR